MSKRPSKKDGKGEVEQRGRASHLGTKVAVAYDRAFCFYYEDNLDLLRKAGAEIVTFSPLADTSVPDDADALYIGGGYPELHAEELSRNESMLRSISDAAGSGIPVYAECGGLMYLSRGIHGFDNNFTTMAAVFPFETRMKKGRSRLGYREARLREDSIIGKKDTIIRGHEFHYSEIVDRDHVNAFGDIHEIYSVGNNRGDLLGTEGFRCGNCLASYIHVHFGSNLEIAKNAVQFIKERSWKASSL